MLLGTVTGNSASGAGMLVLARSTGSTVVFAVESQAVAVSILVFAIFHCERTRRDLVFPWNVHCRYASNCHRSCMLARLQWTLEVCNPAMVASSMFEPPSLLGWGMVFGCAHSFFLCDLTCVIIPDPLAVVIIVVSMTSCFTAYLFTVPDNNLVFSLSVYSLGC